MACGRWAPRILRAEPPDDVPDDVPREPTRHREPMPYAWVPQQPMPDDVPREPMRRREPMPYAWVPQQPQKRDGSGARGSAAPGVDSRSASGGDAGGDAKGGTGGSASASASASSSGGGNAGASASGSRGGDAGASASSSGGGNASSSPGTGGGVWGPQPHVDPPSTPSPSWTTFSSPPPEERDFQNNLIRERLEKLKLPSAAVENLVELERRIEDWSQAWYMDANMDNQAWRAVREGVLEGKGTGGWQCPCGYWGDTFDAWSNHFPWNTKKGHRHAPKEVRDARSQWYNQGGAVLVHINWAHFVQPSV